MTKCANCPVTGACLGERPGHAHACKMAGGTEAERRWVLDASGEMPIEPSPSPSAPSPPTRKGEGGCGCGKQTPSLATKVNNLAKAAVKHAANGFAAASEEEHSMRLAICDSCPSLQNGNCLECGCVVRIKASWQSEVCPLGKWSGKEAEQLDGENVLDLR